MKKKYLQSYGNIVKSVLKTTMKDYAHNHGKKEASALTYFTILSVVPILAISFAIAKGFNLSDILQNKLLDIFSTYHSEVKQVFVFVDNLLSNTSGGLISGVSIIFLLYTSVSLLNNITNAFNKVWGVLEPKPFIQRISDFLAMFLTFPIVVILSVGIASLLKINSELILAHFQDVYFLKYIILYSLQLIPFTILICLITVIFMLIPETKVSPHAAIISAFFTTMSFYVIQRVFISFQIGVAKYNAIYGSFAALPLFFMLIHTSWTIIIIGTYLCKHIHYLFNARENEQLQHTNIFLLRKYCLIVLIEIIKRFQAGNQAISKVELYTAISVPNAVINRAIEALKKVSLISTVVLPSKHTAYQPYMDIHSITCTLFLEKLEHESFNNDTMQTALYSAYPEIDTYLMNIYAKDTSILIKDLLPTS